MKASVRLPAKYDSTRLIDPASLHNKYNQYRLSEQKYLVAIHKELGQNILSDDLVFSGFTVSVKGNDAVASVVESYTYYKDNRPNEENFRRRKYTFDLRNQPNGWKITKVVTSDPWEATEEGFEYKPIDVEQRVNDIKNDMLRARSTPIRGVTISQSRSLYSWSYWSYKAVNYAKEYYKGDTVPGGYNPLFGFSSGVNCQNFASQCVWAGLLGDYDSASSTTAFPAISTSYAGSSALNVWCRNQSSSYSGYDSSQSWTWDNVRGFAKRMSLDLTGYEGPNGTTYHGNLLNADRGDVISCDWNDSASENTLDHAMVVTEASGTLGQRTMSDFKIAANTNSTTSAFQDLTDYASSLTDSGFTTIRIWGGYYSTDDPK